MVFSLPHSLRGDSSAHTCPTAVLKPLWRLHQDPGAHGIWTHRRGIPHSMASARRPISAAHHHSGDISITCLWVTSGNPRGKSEGGPGVQLLAVGTQLCDPG